jgi:hypothetical protein
VIKTNKIDTKANEFASTKSYNKHNIPEKVLLSKSLKKKKSFIRINKKSSSLIKKAFSSKKN